MHTILQILEYSIKYIWLTIIVWWVVHSIILLFSCIQKHHNKKRKHTIKNIRSEFWGYILLALDFIIAADIIATLTERDMNDMVELVIIVGVRIAISYFLEQEVSLLEDS